MATRNPGQEWTEASFDNEAAVAESQPKNPTNNSEWREATFDDAPAPAPVSQAQPAPQAVSAPQERDPLTPWDINQGTNQVRLSEADQTLDQDPGVAIMATDLFRQGITNADEYNEVLNVFFPQYQASGNPITVTNEEIAGARKYEAEMLANGVMPETLFGDVQVPVVEKDTSITGIEAVDTGLNAGARSLGNIANSVTGAAALGAELVGMENTADSLLDSYVKKQAEIQFNYGSAMRTDDVESLGDAGLFAIDTIAELLPQLTIGMGLGALGSNAATMTLRRGAQEFVEDKVANGVQREVAERMLIESLRRRAQAGAIAGAGSSTVTQEAGATFGNTFADTNVKAPLMSLAAGVASGAIESILPLRTLGRLNAPDLVGRMNRRFIERAAREGTKDFFIEGGTEAAQEFIQSLPTAVITGESPFTEEMFDQMFQAFVRGGVGGSAVSVTTTAFERTGTNQAQERENSLITIGDPAAAEDTTQPDAPTGPTQREQVRNRLNEITQIEPSGFTEETLPDFLRNPVAREPEETTGRGLDNQVVVDTVNAVAQDWANPPKMTVVNNIDDLEDGIAQAITADGAEGALGAYMPDGSVVFFSDNMKDESEIIPVLFHEVLGHSGLNQEFGDQLGSMLDNLADTNKKFSTMVDNYMGETGQTDFYIAAEEVLAEISEENGIQTNDGILNTLKDFIVKWAKRLGINSERMDNRQIRSILATAHKRIMEGEQQSVSIPGVRYIRVWTVSPSKYIAQDNTFMNTGEGAQVYGRGQYGGTSDDTRSNYIRQFKETNRRRQKAESRAWERWALVESCMNRVTLIPSMEAGSRIVNTRAIC